MSQHQRILEYLGHGKVLTRLNSWSELGILECPARISELRGKGHRIHTEMVTVKNRYGDRVRVAQWTMGKYQ